MNRGENRGEVESDGEEQSRELLVVWKEEEEKEERKKGRGGRGGGEGKGWCAGGLVWLSQGCSKEAVVEDFCKGSRDRMKKKRR